MPANPQNMNAPIVVMGVAGCGKSFVGAALAQALDARFIEGDRLHPEENIALMAAGTPLTDENREGWLNAVGHEIAAGMASGDRIVATCSSLKRRYRNRLRAIVPSLVFVHLALTPEAARERVAARKDHFMPTSLVDSQFADLEPPSADEAAIRLEAVRPLAELVRDATAFLRNSS